METKEVKIEIPEGYEVDKENSTFEKIVFKKKDNKPRSWEEYRAKVPENKLYKVWGVVESKELAKAFIAMMQLMSLRQSWIGDWNSNRLGYAIILDVTRDIMISYNIDRRALTFPDKKMAVDFMHTFKDLLEIAKPLI